MTETVSYRREGDVGLIRIDNPPVNALGQNVRAGLMAALEAGRQDSEAAALVLYGAGRTFVAGADIREFGKPPLEPSLRAVIAALDDCDKPTIVALHGTPLGGGLELSLACHSRVALPGTRLGLPEVKLGLLPGAGGTQRLPRLTGIEAALDIIPSGRFVPAEEALSLGILDAVSDAETPEAAGLAQARAVIDAGAPPRRVRDRDERLAAEPTVFEQARQRLARRARGQISPLRCVDAIEAATTLPFDQGLKRERQLFDICMESPQRAAMIHAFFGERAVAKVPGLGDEVEERPVERAAVIGAGTMGGGIAMAMANAGLPVILVERDQEALTHGLERLRANYRTSVERGSLTEAAVEQRLALIVPTLEQDALAEADLVVEAAFEDMAVKQAIFAELDKRAKAGAVLATNTSYLDVDEIARATTRPADVLGMHFFSPANVMRLLEVVRASATHGAALKTALAVGKRLGKVSVVAGVCDGFIGNRMLNVYQRQVFAMLEDGCLPAQIDGAMTGFGFAMGPLAVGDLAGLDIGYANRRRLDATRDPAERYVELPDRLYELGRLGQKSGAGWYRYEPGKRTPLPDPEVEALVLEASRAKGIARRDFDDEEIRTRALTALANEGAKILEEGIAARSVDIDMVWIHGYGFPAHEGGPMFWADARGLPQVLADVERFAAEDAQAWKPAPLLARLAADGGSFKSWSETG